MTVWRIPVRRISLVFVGLLTVAPLVAAIQPEEPQDRAEKGKQTARMLDARVNLPTERQRALAARPGAEAQAADAVRQAEEMGRAIAEVRRTMPGLEVKTSQISGLVSSVRNKRGALTEAAPGKSNEAIVRDFLAEKGAIYGLAASDLNDMAVLGSSPGGSSGLRMLRMEQRVGGLPVFQSETRFAIDREGRLVKSVGAFVPAAGFAARGAERANWMSPQEAVTRLLASTGRTARAANFQVTSAAEAAGEWTRLAETDDHVAGEVSARKMLFPLAPGVLVPAWALVVSTTGDADWYALVDASTGDVLWRKNIREYVSTHEARFRVYVQADGITPADSPAPQSPSGAAPGGGTQFAEIVPTIVQMSVAQNIVASPNGWIDDCPGGVCSTTNTNTSTEQTVGNNVRACLDRFPLFVPGPPAVPGGNNVCDTDAASALDGFGKPTGNPDISLRNRDFLGVFPAQPRDFQTNFLPTPQGGAGNPEVGQDPSVNGNGTSSGPGDIFRRGSTVQQFYVSNWYHDKLFALGFDEPSANFQLTNFQGLGGAANDRVLVDVQDGSGRNNANFATPPDGTSGRAQMFLFAANPPPATGLTVPRDGGLDAEILIHELTHGTSNRLVGNAAGLNWDTGRGMGEGWADFYAISLLNNTNADTPSGNYASGGYATFKLAAASFLDNYVYGIRRFPYSTTNAVNPMTWADVDDVTNALTGGIPGSPLTFNLAGGHEVHNSGEIWALTLWEVRSRIIADPLGANGSVPTGNNTTLEIVTDALKLTPIDPTYIEARDALFDADCATNLCANEESIWGGFADRGLGYTADAPYSNMGRFVRSHQAIHESFSLPFLNVENVPADVVINDSALPGNNNGAIDFSEPVLMTVGLTNPWRAASKAVAAATATPEHDQSECHDHRQHLRLRCHRPSGHGDRRHLCVQHRADRHVRQLDLVLLERDFESGHDRGDVHPARGSGSRYGPGGHLHG